MATLAQAIAADLGHPLATLRVDGGLARSRSLMQAQADLLRLPVQRYPHAEATALGVAALARLGSGSAIHVREAIGEWTPSATFEPRISEDEAQTRLQQFARATQQLVADVSGERPEAGARA